MSSLLISLRWSSLLGVLICLATVSGGFVTAAGGAALVASSAVLPDATAVPASAPALMPHLDDRRLNVVDDDTLLDDKDDDDAEDDDAEDDDDKSRYSGILGSDDDDTPPPPLSATHIYGMYDFESNPGGGWDKVDNIAEFNNHKAEFIAFYNANGGVPAINSWTSSNCCWTLRSGKRLFVDNSHIYPHQNGVRCNGAAYSGTFKFYRPSGDHTYDTLSSSTTFSEGTTCPDNNNPAIYWKAA